MRRFALTRTALAVAQLGVVLVAAFALTALLPGDAAVVVAGEDASPGQVATIRAQLGLDQPLAQRFWHWLGGLLHGDLGRSLVTGVPVVSELGERLPVTVVLAACALSLIVPLALALGISCGLREGSRIDRLMNLAMIVLHALPEFVLGLSLLAAFVIATGWLPATAAGHTGFDLLVAPAVLVLPATVLASRHLCDLARQVRIGVAEHATGELSTQLRLLGLAEHRIVVSHVLPNMLAPVVQQFARTVEWLLCGAVIVEALFAIRGLGSGFVEAVQNRDVPAVQGYVMLFTTVVVAGNLLADLVAYRLTPRRELIAR